MKMVHNGIEYGIMQAYAEGFDIFRNATSKELPEDQRYDLNLAGHRRSVAARQRGQFLAARSDGDGAGGESRRSPNTAASCRIPAKAAGRFRPRSKKLFRWMCLSAALFTRFRSRQEHTFAEKMLSAMRQKFGGHIEPEDRQKDA